MANFDRSGMTQAGINLMGKAVGGATIQFTRLVLGDGTMTGEILDLQGVVSPKQNVDVTRIERNDNQCTVGGELLTSSVKQGFFWRECGLYAMDPDVGEILYNYAYSTKPDYIAQSDSGMMEEILVSMVATVGSNTNVDVTIDSSMVFATKKEIDIVNLHLNSKFNQLNETKASKVYITPEEFNALGDGVTDDTMALQNAINYSIANKIPLKSLKNKTYNISNTLLVSEALFADFGDATIKAISPVSSIIEINHPSDSAPTGSFYGTIKNVIFDCNNKASIGLHVVYGRKKFLQNIIFENVSGIAFKIEGGYEVIANNWHINGTSANCVGMYLGSSDCQYSDILMIDCHTAIKNYGLNFLTNVHAWISNYLYLPNSVFVELNGGILHLIACYCDTYYVGFSVKAVSHIYSTNLHYIINESLYNNSTMPGILPYVMYFDNSEYSRYINFRNSYIKGTTYTSSKLHNLTDREFQAQFGYDNNTSYLSNGTKKTNVGELILNDNKFTLISSNLEKRSGIVSLDYVISVNISNIVLSNQYVPLNIPEGFQPISGFIDNSDFSSEQYGSPMGLVYNFIGNAISIRIQSNASGVIFIRGHFIYLTKQ